VPSVFTCILTIYFFVKIPGAKKVKRVLLLSVFFLHIIFTASSSRDYRVASNMSKGILKQVSERVKAQHSLKIENLPAQFRGTKIFSMGFKEGLNWLYNTDTSKVSVVNFTEITTGKNYLLPPYKVTYPFQLVQSSFHEDVVFFKTNLTSLR
jgi:hypothetical protein